MTVTYPWGYQGARLSLAEMETRSTWNLIDPEMRRRVVAMMDAAQDVGVTLGVGGGARTTAEQTALFLSRYATCPCPSIVVWNGKCWVHVSGASAAPPGDSYHEVTTPEGYALALDMIGDMAWLHVHGPWFGVHDFGAINNEAWHIQPIEIPNSRREYVAGRDALMYFALPGPPIPPIPPAPQSKDDMNIAVMTLVNTHPPTTFLGYAEEATQLDGTINYKFWKVYWIDGNDPDAMKMLNDQIAGGAKTHPFGEHVAVSLFYENDVLPSSTLSDGRAWAKTDWGAGLRRPTMMRVETESFEVVSPDGHRKQFEDIDTARAARGTGQIRRRIGYIDVPAAYALRLDGTELARFERAVEAAEASKAHPGSTVHMVAAP